MAIRIKDNGASKVLATVGSFSSRAPAIDVGVIGESTSREEGLTNAIIAEIHELGLGVPERSWLRAWIDENQKEIQSTLDLLNRQVAQGRITSDQYAHRFGAWAVSQIQARISARIDPPLAQSTIDRKGSSVPLIDSGQFRTSINHRKHK